MTVLERRRARARTRARGNCGNAGVFPWGFQSKYYSAAATAELVYEAEALTTVNGAYTVTGAGASGGSVVAITGLPGGSWVSMLTTEISSGSAQMTHQGSFRVWARCWSDTGTPEFQFQWGVGSLSAPVTNDPVQLPGSGAFYLLDLGVITLQPPPVGTNEWFGVVQAYSAAGNDNAKVDVLYLQPLDEAAGQCQYLATAPASSVSTTSAATTGTSVTGVGTIAWTSPDNIAVGGAHAMATGSGSGYAITHYLEATGFGFSIPSGATIVGIEASVTRLGSGLPNETFDSVVKLLKAGAVTGSNRSAGAAWIAVSPQAATFGSPADLWGTTWAPSDVNSSGFGLALAASVFNFAQVFNPLTVTVYYTFASGFSVAADAVVYASQTSELRWNGMYRSPGSSVYGPISVTTGDLPRLPPGGMENRPCRLLLKPTRGDLNVLADAGLDAFTVTVAYRPTWLFRP